MGILTGIVNNPVRVSVELTQNGANIDYIVWIYALNDNDGAHGYSGTLNGYTFGQVKDVSLNDPGSPNGSVTIGHVWLSKDITTVFPAFYNADIAYAGEYPEVRTRRVCDENGIPWEQLYAQTGTVATQMGAQPVAAISDILAECMDVGYLVFDSRSSFGLMLQPMEWRYDRNRGILVDYGKIVAGGLQPVDDDQGLFNDVTVTRQGGSSGRYTVDTGPLSIQDPPNGVGPYPVQATMNLYTDDYAQYWAQWLAHFGSYDESRYPVVAFDLLKDPDQTLIQQVVADLNGNTNVGLEVGQTIKVSNLPDWLPGGPLEMIINGWTERIGPFNWDIVFNCSPAGPWRTWVVEDPATSYAHDDVSRGHVDTAGSETVGSFIAGTNTTLTVKTNTGPRWVTTAEQAAAFPQDILVSGCRLRVTGIVGTSSAGQTFTVSTTVVNGVIKTIPSGSAVNIWPVYVGV